MLPEVANVELTIAFLCLLSYTREAKDEQDKTWQIYVFSGNIDDVARI